MARKTKRSTHHPVQVSVETHAKVKKLRDQLQAKTGLSVSLHDVIARGLDCLEDAHAREAWLNPAEAMAVLEQRFEERTVVVTAQIFSRFCPGLDLERVSFDPTSKRLFLEVNGQAHSFFTQNAPELHSKN